MVVLVDSVDRAGVDAKGWQHNSDHTIHAPSLTYQYADEISPLAPFYALTALKSLSFTDVSRTRRNQQAVDARRSLRPNWSTRRIKFIWGLHPKTVNLTGRPSSLGFMRSAFATQRHDRIVGGVKISAPKVPSQGSGGVSRRDKSQ